MSDEVWKRDEIESPCNKVCVIHPGAKICVGCFRTGAEIAEWSRMTPEARRALMDELPGRESRLREAGVRPSARTGRSRRR
ncbi:DUF1289 domain-containing protein [Rhodovulum sp. DZ06]|uniref:DUF1289 domain-containing protein n=1 Tax=Rhodovulum sp. DZ06 TaxID=3425126 RepID=UPI003D327543